MNMYPASAEVVKGALAFKHDQAEVKAVQFSLMKDRKYRNQYTLTAFGRAFCKRFIKDPVAIHFNIGEPARFNHTKQEITIGRTELIQLMHEIGHAKYGESEEAAVFYSVGLLLKALPDFVPQLDGHILCNDPY